MKDEIIYSERYKKPGREHLKAPIFHSEEMTCVEAYTLEAGHCLHHGEKMEYQVVKVYFTEKSPGTQG